MKRFIIIPVIVAILGSLAPILPVEAKNSVKVNISEKGQLEMASKTSKKTKKEKKKKTKNRVKRLNQLGIPKSSQKYGKDLSLVEMGNIIANWIVEVWVSTGQLPATLTNDQPDWLNVKINGECVTPGKICDRWTE